MSAFRIHVILAVVLTVVLVAGIALTALSPDDASPAREVSRSETTITLENAQPVVDAELIVNPAQ